MSHKHKSWHTADVLTNVATIPLSLYIHIPWCVKKCPYCDFNSHALTGKEEFARYVNSLLADAKAQVPFVQGRKINTVFIGGGTPSLLPIAEFVRLFHGLKALYAFADDCEITLEANPGTLEHAPFEEYLNIGINRLSIGVQSFDAHALQTLGRIHNPTQASHAITAAKRAGFLRINADLMHGLPAQNAELAVHDIRCALDAGATHISWYQLTVEPNTAFYRRPPDLPDEDTLAQIEHAGRQLLIKQGFDNYEVSAWVGSHDTVCRHNLNYWQFGDYLAIGAGAHGKVSIQGHDTLSDGIYRFSKSRLPKDYMTHQHIHPIHMHPNHAQATGQAATDGFPKFVNFKAIATDELTSEYMMNALRLRHGVDCQDFKRYTGLDLAGIASTVKRLKQQKLLIDDTDRLAPTALGFRHVNYLVQQFLACDTFFKK
ncbi:MAG: radical SAM family heme chaperone HemW [Moraxella sp.]|nr:radical SAM family heme chaperone HemW [Moraxella sp.]